MRMFKRVKDILVIPCAVKMFVKVIVIFVILNCGIVTSFENTGLIKENDNHLLFLSTLDGFFICVEGKTGLVRWKLKEEPVIRLPTSADKVISPFFLPDPKDGSLYMFNSNDHEALSKLPFTIPQLVASSPCRSSDGIIFTGKKLDTWFTVNPENGAKRSFLTYNSIDLTCPREGPDIYIGRTEYNIVMVDPRKKDKTWNVTFYDYFAYSMDSESTNKYKFLHFTGSSSGRILTLDRETGSLIWQLNCESPIVDIYIFEARGLLKVPFTSVAEPTLDQLIDDGIQRKQSELQINFKTSELKFFPTLYIGECVSGLYALPALVDENTATIALTRKSPLLLEGPKQASINAKRDNTEKQSDSKNIFKIKDLHLTFSNDSENDSVEPKSVILLGHYKVPENTKPVLQIQDKSNSRKFLENESNIFESKTVNMAVQTDNNSIRNLRIYDILADFAAGNSSDLNIKEVVYITLNFIKYFVLEQENLEIKVAIVTLIIVVISMAWYFNKQMRDIQQLSQSSKSRDSSLSNGITAVAEETDFGVVKVGKIEFNAEEILGKGCEGTFVFKGKFDDRPVAVKRILPECFTFADREVELLRESDHHPNVVRYYCMEQDKQFRYLALELCAATLQDYIEGKFKNEKIIPTKVLQEAMLGLRHLHSLSIVHRDIKPHNVLLSVSSLKNEVRAMISDFGLCKKLKFGRTSFSRRSGITGTDGWIAPEMLSGETRTTCAVDIFSMGCVFYYVLTKGKHAFGDALHRQANILSGDYDLSHLDRENQLAIFLVKCMIALSPLSRPSANAILQYPIFWDKTKVLGFFQDVSDRIEKEDMDNFILKKLEENSAIVVKGDWRFQIDSEVAKDLRKFRSYQGDRVRDLLRALRNKKHHYRELSEQAQKNLGDLPENFVCYWMNRFPLLLIHTWLAMQCVKNEPVFSFYYDNNYNFQDLSRNDYQKYEIYCNNFIIDSNTSLDNLTKDSVPNKNQIKQESLVPINSWRYRGTEADKKWMLELDSFDFENSSLDLKNFWFRQWMKSNFRDDEAYIRWRKDEFFKNSKNSQCPDDNGSFVSEPPSWQLREKFKSLVLEYPKAFNNYQSPKKVKTKRYFQKKSNKKQDEERPLWALPS